MWDSLDATAPCTTHEPSLHYRLHGRPYGLVNHCMHQPEAIRSKWLPLRFTRGIIYIYISLSLSSWVSSSLLPIPSRSSQYSFPNAALSLSCHTIRILLNAFCTYIYTLPTAELICLCLTLTFLGASTICKQLRDFFLDAFLDPLEVVNLTIIQVSNNKLNKESKILFSVPKHVHYQSLRTVSSTQSSVKWVCHNTFIFLPKLTSLSTHGSFNNERSHARNRPSLSFVPMSSASHAASLEAVLCFWISNTGTLHCKDLPLKGGSCC